MSTEILLKEKLDKMLFLEVNLQVLNKIFHINIEDEIYLPIHSNNLIDEVKKSKSFDKLNIGDFIEGMFYVIGCDPIFRYSSLYKSILMSNEELSKKVVKKAIYDKIQKEDFLEAYIMLKGLSTVDESHEVLDKLLLLAHELAEKDNNFKEEMLTIISKAKNAKIINAYYYESMIYFEDFDYEKASSSLEQYFSLGGKENESIVKYKEELAYLLNYKLGKDKLYENPKEALARLIPLVDMAKDDAVLYYYIGVAFRMIENHEKAIFYLNDALHMDKDFVDVVNELGLNYACLGEYREAIKYFKRAFEVSQAIEICTNIIMTYNSLGDREKAKEYIEIGKKINPEDEVLRDIQQKLGGEGKWN